MESTPPLDAELSPATAAPPLVVLVGNWARGVAMGTADLVPGVSGGTVALVLGIYERLVAAIRHGAGAAAALLRGDLRGAGRELVAVEWRLVVPLLAGILTAVFVLAGPMGWLLDHHPVAASAAFFGLVAGSVPVAARSVGRWDPRRLAVAVGTALVTAVVLGLRGGQLTALTPPVAFVGGAVAVCAMILPGISGSFLLLTIGLYEPVLDAVHGRAWGVLVVFAAGAAVGLGSFATALHWLLRRAHDTVVAALIGLLVGSLRVLWPWPAGVGEVAVGAPGSGELPGAVAAALLGAVAATLLGRLDPEARRYARLPRGAEQP